MQVKLKLPNPWAGFLNEVDQSLSRNIEVRCLGGFVFTVLYEIPRVTLDIDYISTVPNSASQELQTLAGPESNLAAKYRVYFQPAGGVTDLPEDYEERLTTLDCGLSNIALKALDPYDLVLSKLTRNSPKDMEDVKALAQKLKLSFARMIEIFDREMRPWLPNLQREQITLNIWKDYFAE
jgi:hypothetical protein